MTNFWRGKLFRQTWHPTFEDLLLFLDGEAGSPRDRVEEHIRNCWSCRSQVQRIDRAIADFMESRNLSFSGTAALPANILPKFAERLDRLEAESGRPSLFADVVRICSEKLTAPLFPARLAVFVAVLVLLAVVFVPRTQRVSAKEILLRVRHAETLRLTAVQAPVIYEKLHLARTARGRSDTATWEIWNDLGNRRVRQSVKPEQSAPVADFGSLCRDHRVDFARPLSTGNYEIWRESIPRQVEEVVAGTLPGGEKAAILKVSGAGPFAPDSIVSAELTVRAEDWHPVGQRLVVRDHNDVVDYSVGEIAYEVVALNNVPASIFAEPIPPRRSIARLTLPHDPPVPVHFDLWTAGAALLPAAADLTAAEVEAHYALHSVKACIGRPLSVKMEFGRIAVEGTVETDARKAEVLLALRGIPYVTADIRSLESSPLTEGPAGAQAFAPDEAADPAKARLATERLLGHYFESGTCAKPQAERLKCVQDNVAAFTRDALAHSEGAQAQAWALRRLVEWGPFLDRAQLRTATRRLLEVMVRDHLEALGAELK
ncbi:MAG: hypothetical protein U0Q18_30030 [Bryobacteraceae bacterium]